MMERLYLIVVVDMFVLLDVVLPVQWRHRPAFPVLRIEKTDLDHDSTRVCLRDVVLQAPEILRVPVVEVEEVSARAVPGCLSARPRLNEISGSRRERIFEAKRALWLNEGRRINTRVVQPVRLERFEIGGVIEAPVDYRAIMFGGGDKNCRPSPQQIIVGVLGMRADRL